jgi:hypothetical protein
MHWCRTVIGLALVAIWPAALAAQNANVSASSDVRQIVTFLFQPGRAGEALSIYEKQLKPIYTDVAPLRRFRVYREVESPEPLDFVVISSYDGMAGMDAANEALRRPHASGQSAFALYGTLSAMTQTHHDQFVEMLPALSDTTADDADLTVFEYVRVAPGAQARFSTLLRTFIRPFERARGLYVWSETGRMLVSDGWDFVRIYGIRSLADWQRAREQLRTSRHGSALDGLIAARKTLILRRDSRLSVR